AGCGAGGPGPARAERYRAPDRGGLGGSPPSPVRLRRRRLLPRPRRPLAARGADGLGAAQGSVLRAPLGDRRLRAPDDRFPRRRARCPGAALAPVAHGRVPGGRPGGPPPRRAATALARGCPPDRQPLLRVRPWCPPVDHAVSRLLPPRRGRVLGARVRRLGGSECHGGLPAAPPRRPRGEVVRARARAARPAPSLGRVLPALVARADPGLGPAPELPRPNAAAPVPLSPSRRPDRE